MLLKEEYFEKRAGEGDGLSTGSAVAAASPLAAAAAFIGHHGATGFLGHVAQNGIVHALNKGSKEFHKDFLGNFIYGRDVNAGKDAFMQGIRSALTPEARVLCLEAREYRKVFNDICSRIGWDPDNLTKKQLVAIRRALRGDFRKAARMDEGSRKFVSELISAYKEPLDSMKSVSGESLKQSGKVPSQLLQDALDASPELMDALEAAWKENPYLGNLGRGLSKQINARTFAEMAKKNEALKGLSKNDVLDATTRLHNAGELVGGAALGVIEPFTPLFNLKKRALTTKSTREFMERDLSDLPSWHPKRKLQDALHWLKYWTTDRPMYAASHKGLHGMNNMPEFVPEGMRDNAALKGAFDGVRMYSGNMPLASINEFNNRVLRALQEFNGKTANSPYLEKYVTDPEFQKSVNRGLRAKLSDADDFVYRTRSGGKANPSAAALPPPSDPPRRKLHPLNPARLAEYEME